MNVNYCGKCGSFNHNTDDCSKPGPFVPDAAFLAELERRKPAVKEVLVDEPDAAATVAKVRPGQVFEDDERWPGAPKVCVKENLLAFEDEKALDKFLSVNCPGAHKLKRWRCEHCAHWHQLSEFAGPSGASSGTSRHNDLPLSFKPFLRQETRREMKHRIREAESRTVRDAPMEMPQVRPVGDTAPLTKRAEKETDRLF